MMFRPIFHLAFPVQDLEEAKKFYVTTFGARVGRVRDKWIDIFLFEGQITLHERPSEVLSAREHGVRHFGAILAWRDWEALALSLNKMRVQFKVKPNVYGVGTNAEQAKMLLSDPSGNVIEVKAYRNPSVALEMEDLEECSASTA
ncbi:MAG: VOC family protein [Nostoc sp. LPT]|nr:VOC family protein [Nostoc sp. LPT]